MREILQERYTPNIEAIYRVTIEFLIETLVHGYENGLKRQQDDLNSTEDWGRLTSGASQRPTNKNDEMHEASSELEFPGNPFFMEINEN